MKKTNSLELRRLGRSELQVSPLAFGGNVFGWTVDETTAFSLLDAWVDAGCNLIDTADVYSVWVPGHAGGESETIIGRWLRCSGKRDRVVLASKVGKRMGHGGLGLKPSYIRAAVEDSLRRLQTDCIDLYQSHDDDSTTPLEDTLATYGDLIQAGKIRVIGASNYSSARLVQALQTSTAHGLPRYESLQPLFNLYDRQPFESELAPICLAHEVGVLNYYGLAAGFLTGKYRQPADAMKSLRGHKTVARYLNPRGLRILAALDAVADRHHATATQAALAWQMTQPSITAPIVSASSLAQLLEIVAAVQLVLSADDLQYLADASA